MKLLIDYDRSNPISIEAYAKRLMGKTFQQVLDDDSAEDKENINNRGDLGQLIERHHFHYECNNDSAPDFPEAGVELKVTPYKQNVNGSYSAKERLVLTKINYFDVINEPFDDSHLWKKSNLILLIYYLYKKEIKKRFEYEIKYSKLYTPPKEDLLIIKKDYELIVNKIRAGLAHELSESDTMYLAACTKGAKSTDRTKQPCSEVEAKPRAFSFKQSYMTYVLNNYIIPGRDTYEPAVTIDELRNQTFEDALKSRLSKYVGLLEHDIAKRLGVVINENDKGYEGTLICNMLGVKSNRVEEFVKAGILVKIVKYRMEKNKNQQFRLEDVKLKEFDDELFDEDILDEFTGEPIGWEYSELYNILTNRKYLFAVFWETDRGCVFKGCQLWGMPDKDIEIVRLAWKKSKKIVREGIKLELVPWGKTFRVNNNLPGMRDNGVVHFRNHASKTYYQFKDGTIVGDGSVGDSDLLPNEERMTRQAYWLNRVYLDTQIIPELRREY